LIKSTLQDQDYDVTEGRIRVKNGKKIKRSSPSVLTEKEKGISILYSDCEQVTHIGTKLTRRYGKKVQSTITP